MTETFLHQYHEFVDGVTSLPSKDYNMMLKRLEELNDSGADISRLITASDGLCAESGEFKEIIKKMLWQGKPYNEENIFHMKRELGDVIFYWMEGCIALNLNPYDVIQENIKKLESRYPGGFSIERSEVRSENDL